MTDERKQRPDAPPEDRKAEERFDAALKEATSGDDGASCEDAHASAFLERFPAAAREVQRPKKD